MDNNKIVIYTLPGCSYCAALKNTLKMQNIHFEVNENRDEMVSLGFKSVPQLKVGDRIMNYKEATEWARSGAPMQE